MSTSLSEAVEAISLSPPLVVENDRAMQERLHYVLSMLGCDEPQIAWTDDDAAAMHLLESERFGVALVDIGLPDGRGIELIEWLQTHHPQVPAVAISASSRTEIAIFSALRAGAVAYLLKERDDLELSIGLRSIEQGGALIDAGIARRILAWHAEHASDLLSMPEAMLTLRERNMLELVVQGLTHRDIAETLSTPRLAVERRTRNIYRKLALGSRAGSAHPLSNRAVLLS
ncbi:LuxR family transcriptional regulator [Variovorax sp. Root318D1]|uniref:response regulator transcription factor n=1 Tax=Variovorax sp. Root318D1 TaxID=1736513 RepID=UPI000700086E|nr:response regulator transcription factor [Variovorax sp. Root318D1]KQU88722.1 LuxR family transcriptional regulator [Variovorax sp. Root318D1]